MLVLDKVKLIESFGRKALLVILASVLLVAAVLSEAARSESGEAYKRKVIRQVAQDWIQVGMEQHRRGLYKQAEKSFLQAQEYQEYLSDAEREKLNEVLQQTHTTVVERKRALAMILRANELVGQDRLADAKALLERVRGNAFLTKEERELIIKGLKEIDNWLYGQRAERKPIIEDFGRVDSQLDKQREEIAELYNRNVEFYLAGEFEKAREGFAKIDDILARKAEPSAPTKAGRVAAAVPELEETVAAIRDELLDAGTEPAQKAGPQMPLIESGIGKPSWRPGIGAAEFKVPEPVTDEVDFTEVTNRKRNILRSYTRAVVNDAIAKAQNYVSRGEFDRAKEAVAGAEQTVNKNRLHLGNSLFRRYSNRLKQLAKKIAQRQSKSAR